MINAPPKNIDEYTAGFPPEVQNTLQRIRELIREVAPDAQETIKYRIPTFILNGNLVHFAGFQKHVGFYPNPSGIAAFRPELAAYKSAKGSVQFPLDRPVPYDLLRRIVVFRVSENRERAGND